MTTSWEYSAVAFLDILGFSYFVESDAAATSPKHLDKLIACLAEAKETTPVGELDLRSFSDSVIVSAPLTPDSVAKLIVAIVGLQRVFVKRAVLVRGGIALGKHFSDADSVYSEALVRAYRLERDHARFPRILFDNHLLDWFMNDESCSSDIKAVVTPLLLRDRDGQVFAHYLDGPTMEAHSALISSYEPNKVTASVVEKLQWLATYHNYIAQAAGHAQIIDGPLVAGFSAI